MKNKELQRFMTNSGMTQKQIAQALSVSVGTISLYLKDQYAGDVQRLMTRWRSIWLAKIRRF
ncbi:phage transposase [Haemophilus aegyptius]|nr:phage transposase [Haemophilus aegyptius]